MTEDTKIIKEDFGRVKTHLNVAAKLELQTQEKMYESRLYHLENVLEEMRQREGHFMRLAEETAVLKDQVRKTYLFIFDYQDQLPDVSCLLRGFSTYGCNRSDRFYLIVGAKWLVSELSLTHIQTHRSRSDLLL